MVENGALDGRLRCWEGPGVGAVSSLAVPVPHSAVMDQEGERIGRRVPEVHWEPTQSECCLIEPPPEISPPLPSLSLQAVCGAELQLFDPEAEKSASLLLAVPCENWKQETSGALERGQGDDKANAA